MTPIERAARALCKLEGNPENTKFEGKPMWQSYLQQALAVIEAIREPSAPMMTMVHADGNWSCDAEEIGAAYTAVINAILETKH